MIVIEDVEDGYRITETTKRWTYYYYPCDREKISNNGEKGNGNQCVVLQ